MHRHWEQAWWPLEVTVEEGLRELEYWWLMEWVHSSGQVVARRVPEPNARQKRLLDAPQPKPTEQLSEAKVEVVTRKKINKERKFLAK